MEQDMAIIEGTKLHEVLTLPHKRGDVILADDLGIGLNHRQWFSLLNKILTQTMQTQGFKGLVLIVTTPYESYIDKDARLLFNMEMTTVAKNDDQRWVKMRVEELQHIENRRHEMQTFKTLLRMRYPDGSVKRVMNVKIHYPEQGFLDKYFDLAKIAKGKLEDDLKAEIRTDQAKRNKEVFTIEKFVKEIREHPEKFMKKWQGRDLLDLQVIEHTFQLSIAKAVRVKHIAEREMGIGT